MKKILVIIGMIIFFELIISLFNVPTYIIPAPSAMIIAFINNWDVLLVHTMYTVSEALIGLVLAIIISFFIAILVDSNQKAKKIMLPILTISQTVPIIVIAPIFLIWFGFGIQSKIYLVTLFCLFPITINLITGFAKVDSEFITLFSLLKMSKWDLYKKLKIPMSMAFFMSGLKIAATYAISSAVLGEFMGAKKGLGIYLSRSLSSFNYEMIFVIAFIISALTLLLLALIKVIENKNKRWFLN